MALLEVENLNISVGKIPVVRDVSFAVDEGSTFGIVGESGCGKSLTSLAIMGLLFGTQVNIISGSLLCVHLSAGSLSKLQKNEGFS